MAKRILAIGNSLSTMLRFREHVIDKLSNDYQFTLFTRIDKKYESFGNLKILENHLPAGRQLAFVKLFKFFKSLRLQLKQNYDCIILYGVGVSFLAGIILLFCRRKTFCSVFVFTGLGAVYLRPQYFLIRFFLNSIILPYCPDKIVVLNNDDREFLLKSSKIKNCNISVMKGEGVPEYFSRKVANGSDNINRLVFVSRPVADKGCEQFLKLVTELRKNQISVPISVYGFDRSNSGELAKCYFENLEGLGVDFHGRVEALELHLRKNDLVLIISDREGASRILLECLHLNINFLASNVAGLHNFVPEIAGRRSLTDFTNILDSISKIKWFIAADAETLKQHKRDCVDKTLFLTESEVVDFYRENILP